MVVASVVKLSIFFILELFWPQHVERIEAVLVGAHVDENILLVGILVAKEGVENSLQGQNLVDCLILLLGSVVESFFCSIFPTLRGIAIALIFFG